MLEKLLKYPSDESINVIKKTIPDLEHLELKISEFYNLNFDFASNANMHLLKTCLEPSLLNKKNRLKFTSYLLFYYDQELQIEYNEILNYWRDYFAEFFYRLYFSVIDLTFNCLVVFYDVLVNEDDKKLKSDLIKVLKEKNIKLYDEMFSIYKSEAYQIGEKIRHTYTHYVSPTENRNFSKKISKDKNIINYIWGQPNNNSVNIIDNSKELLFLLEKLWRIIHKNIIL